MTEAVKETDKEVKTRNTDKKRIDKLEKDILQIKMMLHKMKGALGLPENILPKIEA